MNRTLYPYPIYPSSPGPDGSRTKILYRKGHPNSFAAYRTLPAYADMSFSSVDFPRYPPGIFNRHPLARWPPGHHRPGLRGHFGYPYSGLAQKLANVDKKFEYFHGYVAGHGSHCHSDRNLIINCPSFGSREHRRYDRPMRDRDHLHWPDEYPMQFGHPRSNYFDRCKYR